MAKRIRYRLNKLLKQTIEAKKFSEHVIAESRSQVQTLQAQIRRQQREIESLKTREEPILPGYTVIRIGEEPHYRPDHLTATISIDINGWTENLVRTNDVNVIGPARELAEFVRKGILLHLKKKGYR